MTSQTHSRLESLPYDILQIIFHHLNNGRDEFVLAQSSTHFYRAFERAYRRFSLWRGIGKPLRYGNDSWMSVYTKVADHRTNCENLYCYSLSVFNWDTGHQQRIIDYREDLFENDVGAVESMQAIQPRIHPYIQNLGNVGFEPFIHGWFLQPGETVHIDTPITDPRSGPQALMKHHCVACAFAFYPPVFQIVVELDYLEKLHTSLPSGRFVINNPTGITVSDVVDGLLLYQTQKRVSSKVGRMIDYKEMLAIASDAGRTDKSIGEPGQEASPVTITPQNSRHGLVGIFQKLQSNVDEKFAQYRYGEPYTSFKVVSELKLQRLSFWKMKSRAIVTIRFEGHKE